MEFQVIKADEMEVTPRGRKSTVSPELVKAIAKLGPKDALVLNGMTATTKKDKARVSAQIRGAAKQAKREVGIRWSRAGVPQVIVTA